MAIRSIGSGKPPAYQNWTIESFDSWDLYKEFIDEANTLYSTPTLVLANDMFKDYVNRELQGNINIPHYGEFGRHPTNYDEAIARNNYVYWDIYKPIKERAFNEVMKLVRQDSNAEIMQPKMVFNDREIGEFIFERAAMGLEPELYFYSPSKKREIDLENEEIYEEGEKIFLQSDNSEVIRALKVELPNGDFEYIELKGEESLEEAVSKGIVSVTSSNKKVYLYKEKQPKMYKSAKIIVALTRGGWDVWRNDFYTGIGAVVLLEVLESLGYSVEIVGAFGGGRCDYCGMYLNIDGTQGIGRRFVMIKFKDFNQQADMEHLLYCLSDPSFHQVKFVQSMNTIFTLYGDEIETRNSQGGNPLQTWHGIDPSDLVNPLGAYSKHVEFLRGNKDLLDFYIHRIASEDELIAEVTHAVLECEARNVEALKKFRDYESGSTRQNSQTI